MAWFILLPQLILLGGALLLAFLRSGKAQAQAFGWVTGLSFVASLTIFALPVSNHFQVLLSFPWGTRWGIYYSLGIDSFSAVLTILTSALFFFQGIFLIQTELKRRSFVSLLLLELFLVGLFTAGNLLSFYMYWELVMLPVLYLFLVDSMKPRLGLYLFIYTLAGSLSLLAGLLLYIAQQWLGAIPDLNFDKLRQLNGSGIIPAAWVLLVMAFGVKTPLFLFHAWQPKAYATSPYYLTPILAGLVSKMGVYGLYRVAFPLLGPPPEFINQAVLIIALMGVLYGAWLAFNQKNPLVLMAYSSLSHLNLIVFGLFAGQALSWSGSLFLTVQHSLIAFGFFWFLARINLGAASASISGRVKASSLFQTYPYLAGLLLLLVFANVGLPGLAGFVGEFSILFGAFILHPYLTAFAALVVILAAGYSFVWLKSFVYEEVHSFAPFAWSDQLILSVLVLLLVVFGIYPMPLFALLN